MLRDSEPPASRWPFEFEGGRGRGVRAPPGSSPAPRQRRRHVVLARGRRLRDVPHRRLARREVVDGAALSGASDALTVRDVRNVIHDARANYKVIKPHHQHTLPRRRDTCAQHQDLEGRCGE